VGALTGHRRPSSVRPSVRLSDVAYVGSNSKTKRPRKTKLCTGVLQVTCDSHTDFKVKRSKVKVGRGHCGGDLAAQLVYCATHRKRCSFVARNADNARACASQRRAAGVAQAVRTTLYFFAILQIRKCLRRAGGIAVRCVALYRVTESFGNYRNHA